MIKQGQISWVDERHLDYCTYIFQHLNKDLQEKGE